MNILCVCTGNVCRSPMLETLLRRELKKAGLSDFTVSSAGTMTHDSMVPTEQAVTAMKEIGLDISQHTSRQITPAIVENTDVFVALTAEHGVALAFHHGVDPKKILVPGLGVPDPFGSPLAVYRKCRDLLLETLPQLIEDIKDLCV